MKIAIWHNLPSGGGKRALYEYVRGLVERGHSLEAWCPPSADQTFLPLSELIPEHIVPPAYDFGPPTIWRERFRRTTWDVAYKYEMLNRHCQLCAAQMAEAGFDVLFVHPCRSLYVSSIGRYSQLPSVLYLQEYDRWVFEAAPTLPWMARPTTKWLDLKGFARDQVRLRNIRARVREQSQNIRTYDRVLVNSYFSRENVLRAYGVDAQVAYLGVDPAKFQNYNWPRENFILGAGFGGHKNVALAIKAVGHIVNNRPALVWVGHSVFPADLVTLKNLAASLEVDFQPRLNVPDPELIELMNRARVLVCVPRLEPFGYGPLEANACGLPVVGLAEGGLRESVQPGVNGLLVDHDSSPELAAALERLLADPDYARQLGLHGQRLVEECWTLAQAVERVESHLSGLV